jgi:uncharacterized membrane protein
MRASSQPSRLRSSGVPRGALELARVLLTAALVLDLYLAWVSFQGGGIAGCGPASDCQSVLGSGWAYWLGLPVSWPAALVYAITLVATLRLRPDTSWTHKRKAWLILIPCTTMIIAAALWFVSLQLFVLRKICPFCMGAHACGLVGASLLLAWAPVWKPPAKTRRSAPGVLVTRKLAAALFGGALLAVGFLMAGQVFYPRKTYAVTSIGAGVATNVSVWTERNGTIPGLATNRFAASGREFQVLDGRFRFQLQEVPLIGRPEAPHIIVSLFDYTCHHCRAMHTPLMQAYRQFSNELAIVSLPMPLDGKCNPTMRRTPAAHTNACALARLGLAVWAADRSASKKFDDWMFACEQTPGPEAAEQYARKLVGEQVFNKAVTNAWIDRQVQQDVSLYEALYRQFRKSYMPEVLIGTNLISGPFSGEQLFQTLAEQFGLRPK